MKLKIVLLLTALFLSGITQAQVSKESYEKAVDMLNCKSVYFSLSVLSPTKGVTTIFKSNCNCEDNPSFEKIKSSIPKSEESTLQIAQDIEKIKTKNIPNLEKESLKKYITENILEQTPLLLKFKNDLIKKDKYTDFQNEFVALNKILVYKDISQPSLEVSGENHEKKDNQKEIDYSLLGDFKDYVILFSTLLAIAALIISLRKKGVSNRQESSDVENYIKKIVAENNLPRNSSIEKPNVVDLKALNDRIRDLEERFENLNLHIKDTNSVSHYTAQATQPTYLEVKQPEVRSEIFFLSSPNADGSFDESSASSSHKEGATIYRFTKIGNNKANFQIDNKEASIKLALQYRDRRIDPVCEATNAFNQAKNISTIQQGEAELQSGKWVVNKKAKIKYEH